VSLENENPCFLQRLNSPGSSNPGPSDHASWTTGNKVAVGASSKQTNRIWFTVANGITGEVCYPRHDILNIQDLR
jgi:Glucodextranase, domain N